MSTRARALAPLLAYLRTLLPYLLMGGALQAAGVPLGWMIGSAAG